MGNITRYIGGQNAVNTAGSDVEMQIARVSNFPDSPDANTLYMTNSTISNAVTISAVTLVVVGGTTVGADGGSGTLTITGDAGSRVNITYSTGVSGASTATIASGQTSVDVDITWAAYPDLGGIRDTTVTVTRNTENPETVFDSSIFGEGVNSVVRSVRQFGTPEPTLPFSFTNMANTWGSVTPSSGGGGTSISWSFTPTNIPSEWSVQRYSTSSANRYWVGSPFPVSTNSGTLTVDTRSNRGSGDSGNINCTVTFIHSNGVTVQGVTSTAGFTFTD